MKHKNKSLGRLILLAINAIRRLLEKLFEVSFNLILAIIICYDITIHWIKFWQYITEWLSQSFLIVLIGLPLAILIMLHKNRIVLKTQSVLGIILLTFIGLRDWTSGILSIKERRIVRKIRMRIGPFLKVIQASLVLIMFFGGGAWRFFLAWINRDILEIIPALG